MQNLPDWVNARALHAAPIHTLKFWRCSIRSQTIDKLMAIQGLEVRWDGKQGIYKGVDECGDCNGQGCERCMGENFAAGSEYETDGFESDEEDDEDDD